jgi:predicted Zn-dependent protease with MMP-like domain
MADTAPESGLEKNQAPTNSFSTLGGDLLSKKPEAGAKKILVASSTLDGTKLNLSAGDLYGSIDGAPERVADVGKSTDKSLHPINMGTSVELANKVQDAIDKLPPQVRQQLEKEGVQVYTFKDINQYDKQFGTNKGSEIVDGHSSAADDATSLNDLNAHPPRIAIFERTGNGQLVSDSDDIGGLTRHELGHVITNHLIPKPDGSGDFDRQLATIASSEGSKVPANLRNGILQHYFHAGPAEIYAETFAMAVGGGSSRDEDRLIQRYFPQTLGYLRHEFVDQQN